MSAYPSSIISNKMKGSTMLNANLTLNINVNYANKDGVKATLKALVTALTEKIEKSEQLVLEQDDRIKRNMQEIADHDAAMRICKADVETATAIRNEEKETLYESRRLLADINSKLEEIELLEQTERNADEQDR